MACAHRGLRTWSYYLQHDVSAHILVDTTVVLHDPLLRSVVEYSGFCASETLLDQLFHEMGLFTLTADSDYAHSFSELFLRKVSDLLCAPEEPPPYNTVALRRELATHEL